jgi:polysaccharide export outer membrane protein
MLMGSALAWSWQLQPGQTSDAATAVPDLRSAGASLPSAPVAGYRIGVNDVLTIAVWQESEFSATVPVRTDGKISVPLLHDVQAAGLTPIELTASLTEKLKKYIDDPRVTVVVSQMTPQRIYVVGEVMHHGPMVLLPDLTVLQALATAGLTQFANAKKIYVLRSVNGTEQKFPVNYKRLLKGEGMAQNIALKTGDTIVVP